MGNLGAYQVMTTLSKKVGGPVKLAAGIAVGGYVVIRTAEGVIKTGIKKVKKHKEAEEIDLNTSKLYTVHECGESNEGLIFNISDTYRVLEKDGTAVLIEKIGDANNPYFVFEELLRKISDYEE
jgi:hypothetical protein